MTTSAEQDALRRTVLIVAALNLAYFGIEFAVALAIGSVSVSYTHLTLPTTPYV